MAKTNRTQYAILGCLLIKPMTAYEIKRLMQQSTQHFWAEREGQLYPTFQYLLKNKYVICHELPSDKGGMKKQYEITPVGKKHFHQWYTSKTEIPIERNEALLKLFFGRSQTQADVSNVLNELFDEVNSQLATFKLIETSIEQKKAQGINTLYYEMVLDYGIQLAKTEIRWCKQALQILNVRLTS